MQIYFRKYFFFLSFLTKKKLTNVDNKVCVGGRHLLCTSMNILYNRVVYDLWRLPPLGTLIIYQFNKGEGC